MQELDNLFLRVPQEKLLGFLGKMMAFLLFSLLLFNSGHFAELVRHFRHNFEKLAQDWR